MPKTLGESRVRIQFNPANIDHVFLIKTKGAELIDLIHNTVLDPSWDEFTVNEWRRLKALSLTEIESGTSWAVKAATIKA